MKLYEDNEAEYGVLANLIYLAEDCEKNGNRKDASDFYSELLEKSNLEFFQHLAQARLYRLSRDHLNEKS